MNTFSHCQYYTIKGNQNYAVNVKPPDIFPSSEKSDSSDSLQPPPTTAAAPELGLQITPPTHNFSEVDHVNVSR